MGPGYFPRILGILLILLGAVLALRALRTQGRAIAGMAVAADLIVLGSVVLFGLIVRSLGMAIFRRSS